MDERSATEAPPLADPGSFVADDDPATHGDPLQYPGYRDALDRARSASGADEAVSTGRGRIGGRDVELALFAFDYLAGSMGEVVGRRLAAALERAARRRVPFVAHVATGGARMQEGMRSLVQMGRIAAARARLADARAPLVAVLANPSTGGVLVSLGALADVTLAETGATVGFAGPRVVRRFTGTPLPEASHTAASALAHGLVDDVVHPADARAAVARVLDALAPDDDADVPPAPGERVAVPDDAWDALRAARAPGRPRAPQLARAAADVLVELRGDRAGRDDDALLAAFARVAGRRALVLALDRNRAPGPGAYRKARRCVETAARLGVPVVALVDTKGADPSPASESEGIAWAVAELLDALLRAPVPVIAIVTGEGGSGGALAFAVADRVVVYADAVFSVISPDLAAEILWRDGGREADAARLLRPAASDLVALGVADAIVEHPLGAPSLRHVIAAELDRARDRGPLPDARLDRWRRV
ncbi:MAG TPA: carboxyl transferase domain-containing protein [Actinomycetota bacterium]|nr:carboxyl transferase domain-containing protein [Actinomycetota bacterium]